MEKTIFKVKMESEPSSEAFLEKFGEGIECEGFCVIGKSDDGTSVAIHHMNVMGLANAIADSDELMAAAAIAKGLREAREIQAHGKLKGLADLLKNGLRD